MDKKANTPQFWLGCVITIAGIVLLFIGAYLDPKGQIHSSLLIGFGEVATFAGALLGVDYHYKFRFRELVDETEGRIKALEEEIQRNKAD